MPVSGCPGAKFLVTFGSDRDEYGLLGKRAGGANARGDAVWGWANDRCAQNGADIDWGICATERLPCRRFCDWSVRGRSGTWRDFVVVCDRASHWQRGLERECCASPEVDAEHKKIAPCGICRAIIHDAAAAGTSHVRFFSGMVARVARDSGCKGDRSLCRFAENFESADQLVAATDRRLDGILFLGGRIFWEHDFVAWAEVSVVWGWEI